jgi:hypothetical protein
VAIGQRTFYHCIFDIRTTVTEIRESWVVVYLGIFRGIQRQRVVVRSVVNGGTWEVARKASIFNGCCFFDSWKNQLSGDVRQPLAYATP